MPEPITYSFLDVKIAILGPNAAYSLGEGVGNAEEGVTVEYAEEQDTMTIGADGEGMHNLHANQAGTITIRLLKNSSANALLQATYDLDRATPSEFGQNTLTVSWLPAGDIHIGRQAGIRKFPAVTYAKDGPMLEWVFNCIKINSLLGASS